MVYYSHIIHLLLSIILTLDQSEAISLTSISCKFGSFGNCNYRNNTAAEFWTNNDCDGQFMDSVNNSLLIPNDLPSSGNYIRLQTNRQNIKSVLSSPVVHVESGTYCLTLEYYVIGTAGTGKLNVVAREQFENRTSTGNSRYLFSRSTYSSFTDRWQLFEKSVTFARSQFITIDIEGQNDPKGVAIIAIGELLFREWACPVDYSLQSRKCDFTLATSTNELDCDWIELTGYGWILSNYYYDHTTFSDGRRYLAIRTNENGAIHVINLKREVLEAQNHCLSFYAYESTYFNTVVVETELATGRKRIFLDIGNKFDPGWTYFQTEIPMLSQEFSIAIEIYHVGRNGSYSGKLFDNFPRFDDFELAPGSCLPPATCDFTNGTCRYEIMGASHGNGRLYNPNYVVSNFKPPTGGPYLYFDFTLNNDRPRFSQLITSDRIFPGDYCLTVVYFSTFSIDNFMITSGPISRRGSERKTLLELDSDHITTGKWTSSRVSIKNTKLKRNYLDRSGLAFNLDFKVKGLPGWTFFAIKDIQLDNGLCQVVTKQLKKPTVNPETGKFPEVNFRCAASNVYIPQHKVCDSVNDCPLKEDEKSSTCGHLNCAMSGIPCLKGKQYFCMGNSSNVCNGIAECDDGADEDPRLCEDNLFCTGSRPYCRNGGTCSTSREKFGCECNPLTKGKRCQFLEISPFGV